MKRMFLMGVFMVCSAAFAVAAPTLNPSNPYYTYQRWDFEIAATQLGTQFSYLAPEIDQNTYGCPTAHVTLTGADLLDYDLPGWYDSHAGRDGVMFGYEAFIDLWIPNAHEPTLYKEIQVKVAFTGTFVAAWVGAVPDHDVEFLGYDIAGPATGWQELTLGWRIYPQPSEELIHVEFADGANIDWIEAASVCVPAPGAILLSAIGTGFVGWLRRRRTF